MQTLWNHLETIRGLTALPLVWQARLGGAFDAFKILCLQSGSAPATSVPCPIQSSCAHRVTIIPDFPPSPSEPSPLDTRPSTLLLGICQSHPPNCPNLKLTPADITPLELSWPRLGRAICKAFDLDSKSAQLGIPNTIQFASYSADAVPVLLTIQSDRHVFRRVIAELVARLNAPFILFAPTTRQLDAHSQELLARVKAAFFSLDATVTLTTHGTLQPRTPPGKLFAMFTPQPEEQVSENTARQLFALIESLDSETGTRKANPSTILRLYCVDGIEPNQIAKYLQCSRSLVYARLNLLRQKLGRDPAELRQYSAHLSRIEDSMSDVRAKRIHRKGAAFTREESDDP